MFYVKKMGLKVEITPDNVFTKCPDCGKEHAVNITDILKAPDACLYSTAVYCPSCSQKHAGSMEDETSMTKLQNAADAALSSAEARVRRHIV